ncbi:MAG: hypothetical protein R6X18_00680 [Chloroflexota bacterium]
MLEKPDIHDNRIVTAIQAAYGMAIDRISFLPLGADENSAVYRAFEPDSTTYFVKLRAGMFDENTVTVPQFLNALGIRADY